MSEVQVIHLPRTIGGNRKDGFKAIKPGVELAIAFRIRERRQTA
jgi:hypothetical protein